MKNIIKFENILFVHSKDTLNKRVYVEQESEEHPILIGTLYVAKFAANGHDSLLVTLTFTESKGEKTVDVEVEGA